MTTSWRVLFLIVAAAGALRVKTWIMLVILFGYLAFERLDQWLAQRSLEKAIDDEIFGWEPDKDDPEYETKGAVGRVRLTGQSQIIATRIAMLLRRFIITGW